MPFACFTQNQVAREKQAIVFTIDWPSMHGLHLLYTCCHERLMAKIFVATFPGSNIPGLLMNKSLVANLPMAHCKNVRVV